MATLQSLLKERGVRQKDLADALGVSEPSVSRWATRGADIPAKYIRPIATKLGVSVAAVLSVATQEDDVAEAPTPANEAAA